jgi:hypothetical protein
MLSLLHPFLSPAGSSCSAPRLPDTPHLASPKPRPRPGPHHGLPVSPFLRDLFKNASLTLSVSCFLLSPSKVQAPSCGLILSLCCCQIPLCPPDSLHSCHIGDQNTPNSCSLRTFQLGMLFPLPLSHTQCLAQCCFLQEASLLILRMKASSDQGDTECSCFVPSHPRAEALGGIPPNPRGISGKCIQDSLAQAHHTPQAAPVGVLTCCWGWRRPRG